MKPETLVQIPNVEPVKLIISGPSGVGKDAVVKALQAARPDLHFVITATSRCAVNFPGIPASNTEQFCMLCFTSIIGTFPDARIVLITLLLLLALLANDLNCTGR